MTTTEIKCLQSRDVDSIDNETLCIVLNGTSTGETSVGGETAAEAMDNAEESGAYGCEVMTVGAWAQGRPGLQAYVLEERGAKDGNVWWLSEVAVTFAVDEENGPEDWWTAARDAEDCPAGLVDLIHGDATEVVLAGEEAVSALAWCEALPGWTGGPTYAPHPLLVR
jgi:hypothetical protein